MKNLLKTIALAILLMALYNCTTEAVDISETATIITEDSPISEEANACIGMNPEARITNNGDVPIDLDIIDANGDVVGFVHNLLPGNTSVWLSFPPGDILFSVGNDTYEDEKVLYEMGICMIFDMEFSSDNELSSATPIQL